MKAIRILVTWVIVFLAGAAPGELTLDGSSVDGGGGSSTGGVFVITGTIGQPDAGAMSGGNFAVQGGFRANIAVVQTPGAPLLSILTTNNTLVLVWPAPATGYLLQETPALSVMNWTNANLTPVTVGSEKRVTLPSAAGNRFYRLHKP